MTNQLSAMIIDDGTSNKLISLIEHELKISNVRTFPSSIAALDFINQHKNISLIFINFETLLDRTFLFVQKAIASNNCENSKFILLASESNKEMLLKAANSGVSAFILKPYKKAKFLEKVKKFLPPIEKRTNKRLNLLESIDATLRYKNMEITGNIVDISSGGCLIHTPRFGRMGVEIFDIVTIRVNFNREKLGVNAEVIRMEKDESKDYKAVSTAFKFTKPDENNALQFARFWAYILKERNRV